MTRLEANRKIVERISKIIEQFPDWRFHQVLENLCIEEAEGKWYEESEVTFKKMVDFVL